MSIRLVTPPAVEPVSLEELKEQLRVVHDDDDVLLEDKIAAARRHVENLSGLTLAISTWDLIIDRFSAAEIELPRSPIASVETVTYTDLTGATLTVASASYVVDTASERGWVVPVKGFAWPDTMATINAVTVRFTAGTAPEDVPEPLREAILQLAAWWYEQREAAVAEGSPSRVPFGVQEIVNEFRGWTF